MSTFIMSAPLRTSSSTISPVTTFPAYEKKKTAKKFFHCLLTEQKRHAKAVVQQERVLWLTALSGLHRFLGEHTYYDHRAEPRQKVNSVKWHIPLTMDNPHSNKESMHNLCRATLRKIFKGPKPRGGEPMTKRDKCPPNKALICLTYNYIFLVEWHLTY